MTFQFCVVFSLCVGVFSLIAAFHKRQYKTLTALLGLLVSTFAPTLAHAQTEHARR